MREIQRIDRILNLLGEIWKLAPDWRLGQILVNATGITWDMFYVEDDEIEKKLTMFLKDLKGDE